MEKESERLDAQSVENSTSKAETTNSTSQHYFEIEISISSGQLNIQGEAGKQLCVLLCCEPTEGSFRAQARILTWLVVPATKLRTTNKIQWDEKYGAITVKTYNDILENTALPEFQMKNYIDLDFEKKYINTKNNPYNLESNVGVPTKRIIRFENQSDEEFGIILKQGCSFNAETIDSPFMALPIGSGELKKFNISPPRDIILAWVDSNIEQGTYKEKLLGNETGYFISNAHLCHPLKVEFNTNSNWNLKSSQKGVKGEEISGEFYLSSRINAQSLQSNMMKAREPVLKQQTEAETIEEEEKRKKIDNAGH